MRFYLAFDPTPSPIFFAMSESTCIESILIYFVNLYDWFISVDAIDSNFECSIEPNQNVHYQKIRFNLKENF